MQAVQCDVADDQCNAQPNRALPIAAGASYFDDVLNTDEHTLKSGLAKVVSGPLLGSACCRASHVLCTCMRIRASCCVRPAPLVLLRSRVYILACALASAVWHCWSL